MDILSNLLIYGLPLLLAIPLHEAAHGYVAHYFGDDTAYRRGRVTMNPIKHIDPLGTVIFPGLLVITGAPFVFGWAKPVPVDFKGLRDPRWHSVWVAAAGPAMNVVLAFASAVALRFAISAEPLIAGDTLPWWISMLQFSVLLNVMLAIFNMMPLLPLDGGRVLNGLLPRPLARLHAKTEPFGFPILIGVLILLPMLADTLGWEFNLLSALLLPPVMWLADVILLLAGVS